MVANSKELQVPEVAEEVSNWPEWVRKRQLNNNSGFGQIRHCLSQGKQPLRHPSSLLILGITRIKLPSSYPSVLLLH